MAGSRLTRSQGAARNARARRRSVDPRSLSRRLAPALRGAACRNGKTARRRAAAPEKAALYDVGEDEAGMRLDRWLRRRFPDLPQTHLMKIVRKGEVRVSGRRADVSTRLELGQTVRVPPLKPPPRRRPASARRPGGRRGDPGDDALRGPAT